MLQLTKFEPYSTV